MVKPGSSSEKNPISLLFLKINKMFQEMDVQREDRLSLVLTFFLLAVWFITLIVFDYPLISILILWIGMISLSIVYSIVYKKKGRDMRILKYRFFASAAPIYPVLFYYVYSLVLFGEISGGFRFLPFFIILLMLALNGSVVYYFNIVKG